jgi:hypothetical protein
VVAIRAANGYAVRAKVSEAVLALSGCRTVVGEVYMSADALPLRRSVGLRSDAIPASTSIRSR